MIGKYHAVSGSLQRDVVVDVVLGRKMEEFVSVDFYLYFMVDGAESL